MKEKLSMVLNWIKLNLPKIGLVLLALALSYTLFLYFHARALTAENAQQLVAAHNAIAQLSHTIQENETTASRLMQERDDQMSQLQSRNAELAGIISSRDERIAVLTQTIANFRPIHIVANGEHATQTTTDERSRVDFDQMHSDYLRVHGFTLTNPAHAELDVEFTRPLELTIVSTQSEDGQWSTYVQDNYEDLEVSSIDASINPHVAAASITEQQEHHGWEDGFQAGIFGGVGTSGNAGQLGVSLGYDFSSAVEIDLMGSGVVFPGGSDIILGGEVSIHPFNL